MISSVKSEWLLLVSSFQRLSGSSPRLLLCWRADPALRCSAGLTVLDSAINAGTAAAAHLLLDHGAGSSQPQDALLVAAGSRCLDLAPRLVDECRADVDGAIDLAVENEDATVVMQLLQLPTATSQWKRLFNPAIGFGRFN